MNLLSVCLFGVLGILSRYSIDRLFQNQNTGFPYSTLVINILGCFLIGILWNNQSLKFPDFIQQGLIIGFCGGFTTYSSFSIQLITTHQTQGPTKSLLYLFLSLFLGLMACLVGLKFSK